MARQPGRRDGRGRLQPAGRIASIGVRRSGVSVSARIAGLRQRHQREVEVVDEQRRHQAAEVPSASCTSMSGWRASNAAISCGSR